MSNGEKAQWKPGPYQEPSISASRMAELEWCHRQLYHGMVTSWRGWEARAARAARLAYALKQLTTADMLLANAVHRLARERLDALLAGSRLATLAEIRAELEQLIDDAIQTSRCRDAFLRKPKQTTMLRSAWYREDGRPDPTEIERVRRKIEPCARNLICSRVWDSIARLAPDQLIIAEDFAAFQLDGMPVRLKPDLVFESGGVITLLDWKTGEPDEMTMRRQVAIYALWLELGDLRVPFSPGSWLGWIENLWSGTRNRYTITAQDLADAELWLLRGVAHLRELLADPETGEPLPIERYPVAAREQRGYCLAACPFLELCRTELGASGRSTPKD